MRSVPRFVVSVSVVMVGCGAVDAQPDARAPIDAAEPGATDAMEAMIDAPPPCQPRTLLVGGLDTGRQGWLTAMQPPALVSYGPDYTRLQTASPTGADTSGQLLLHYPGVYEPGQPFKIQVVMLIEQVNAHNQFDSAAAIMGSFGSGVVDERAQMVYLEGATLGWADDTQTFAAPLQDNAYHVYELSVDAGNVARVSVDGTPALMRNGFMTNGAFAVGDQTNDLNVDSTLRIRSVTKLCP
jgi:hypothetical protein